MPTLNGKDYDLSNPEQREEYWVAHANHHLEGRKIVSCRYLTKEEMEDIGWYHRCVVLQLDDGTVIYPSKDDEGNDAGVLFGQTALRDSVTFPVIR